MSDSLLNKIKTDDEILADATFYIDLLAMGHSLVIP